ncbi:putative two-component system, chemotaxis family, CheB/CheR fusion protein [Magnetofaba australis IT-1]|uniref:protein-glutamate O-methyltransferase n=1 Tax=Magnetofaba australis IT-1 TaxID=1434232 RepID=A0A1Y2K8M1_9PROT|nr:putative two-component system, chemotaxis family, CheB/CheR fusion protein [Magnetofaba australis IT-1]
MFTACDGEEGITQFIEHRPDIVVTDLRMPKKNGIELIASIRQIDASTPIVVLSAYADHNFLTDSVRSKINGHVTKPVNERIFVALIEDLLRHPTPSQRSYEPRNFEAPSKGLNDLSEANNDRVFMVGIGASAGGLEALSALVGGLPERNNTAYLVAQHLSPTHKTLLTDLLARATTLPVKDAEHGEPVLHDIIYITPPNKNIEISDAGRIVLSEPEKYSFLPKPSINQLFLSLAEHWQDRAVGVILSGTGTDGAQGMRAVNAAGGVTIVQDPTSAKYDGMPMAAINGCSVDMIIDPALIGEELVALANFPRNKVLQKHQLTQSNDDMSAIFDLLYRYKKVDFSIYKKNTIARRIKRRMLTLKITSLPEYVDKLKEDENEVVMLFKDILIGVTSFFRDRAAFEDLKIRLREYLKNSPDLEEMRIWIPGASTGEETYSVVITLREILRELRQSMTIRVFATDIDEDALKMARRGVYSEASINELSEEEIQRYFTINDNAFEVQKEIREHVVFSYHNLLSDPPFKNVDLVVCRNLLIYFTTEAQRHIMPMLHYALKDGALLFLGKSENTTNYEHLFATVSRSHKIFKRIAAAQKAFSQGITPPTFVQKQRLEQRREAAPKTLPLHEQILNEASKVLLPDVLVINDQFDIVYKKGEMAFLSMGDGYVTFNLFKMIDPRLSIDLRGAIGKATRNEQIESTPFTPVTGDDGVRRLVRVRVAPLRAGRQAFFVLYFQQVLDAELPIPGAGSTNGVDQSQPLELELQRTREHMQTLVEELETSNEELQSTNEELQSTNEELQSTNEELVTSNEELQSTNEELQTAYAELKEMYQANNVIKEEYSSLSKRYETVLESINDIVVVTTLDGVFVRTNRAMQQISGYGRDALLARSWGELTGEKESLQRARYKEVIDQGHSSPYLLEIVSTTGKVHILNVEDYLIRADDGAHQVWSFGRDVSAVQAAQHQLELSENKYKAIFNRANIGIAQVALNGVWMNANQNLLNFLGYDRDELSGLSFQQITHPEDVDKDLAQIEQLLTGKITDYKLEKRYIRKDGKIVWAKLSVALVRAQDGEPRFLICVVEDINEIKHSMLKMEQASVVFNATQESIIVTDADGLTLSVNDAFERVTGFSAEELIGKPASALKSGKHPQSFYEEMWRRLKKTGIWSGEIINRNKAGELYPAYLNISAVKDNQERIIQYVGVLTDISQLKESQEKIDFLASHDTLTGLPNRTLFMDRLQHAIDKAKRGDSLVALFFTDLDRFKIINDELGHQAGDEVLVTAAKRFCKELREQDTVARLGGDEFVVIIEELQTPIAAGKVARSIITAIDEPIETHAGSVTVGCSIGIAIYPNDGVSCGEMIRHADAAMYESKENGRNTYRFASPELSTTAFEKVTLENALQAGIHADEFILHYQPIVALDSGDVVQAEALLRWNHPQMGMVMPGKFIPVAEESDLMAELDDAVAFEALNALQKLKQAGASPCKLSINLSSRNFANGDLCAKFKSYLAQMQMEADAIVWEAQERALVTEEGQKQKQLARLQKLGSALAIDDFGSGHATLAGLSSVNFDYLKIGRSIIDGIGKDPGAEQLLKTTIAVARALGRQTIAVGIETEAQLTFLRQCGCDYGQGYLLHMPKPLDDLLALLTQDGENASDREE